MIKVHFENPEIQEIISKAMIRSFTHGLVTSITSENASISVSDQMLAGFQKQIIFGPIPETLKDSMNILGVISNEVIEFKTHRLTENLHLRSRHLERYDFEKEWNNLGYGRIHKDERSIWGLANSVSLNYCGVFDSKDSSILWFNRPIGPVDGFDWRIIEDFVSCYRWDEITALPALAEIPANYQGAITFRIDCDEAIASGRPLFELYKEHRFPFSLAIKTEQDFGDDSLRLISDILDAQGSIVIHSHTHAPEWGEPSLRAGPKSRGDAFFEASTALQVLNEKIPNYKTTYAVSPFHQNPRVAIPKLVRAGIDGFVGGIICNDPEYLMARGGGVPFSEGIISHSEQCMFHGDCVHPNQDSLQIYFEAIENALKTETFFGYLDHPFSNYHYGWKSEDDRLQAHSRFLNYIDKKEGIWKASLKDTLDFLWDRANAAMNLSGDRITVTYRAKRRSNQGLKARWRGKSHIL